MTHRKSLLIVALSITAVWVVVMVLLTVFYINPSNRAYHKDVASCKSQGALYWADKDICVQKVGTP